MNEEEANTDLRELEMETRRDADPRHRGKGFDGWTSNIFRADVEGLDTPSCPKPSGPRLNIKTVLSRYGDSYVKDKTAVRTSYL